MIKSTLGLMVATAALLSAGCDAKESDRGGHTSDTHEHHQSPAEAHEGHEATSEFAGLGAEDAALAKAQETCPVSDEPLGSMGDPIKVVSGGRTVFLCCEGCKKKFERDPATFLAKLDGAPK